VILITVQGHWFLHRTGFSVFKGYGLQTGLVAGWRKTLRFSGIG
jgi:hypothetical protein